jgi:hypothetical protein
MLAPPDPGNPQEEFPISLAISKPEKMHHQERRFAENTIWLSQTLIGELFGVSVPTINEHLKGIYADGELTPGPTIRKFRIVRLEGQRQIARNIDHSNLDAILAVGYGQCKIRPYFRPSLVHGLHQKFGGYIVFCGNGSF